MKKLYSLLLLVFPLFGIAQTNILSTTPLAEQVMLGNYDPAQFMASNVINHPDSIAAGIIAEINPDSLKSYIIKLASFGNRNTGSDTVSGTFGVGAARRWVYQKFTEFSAANESRLIPSYLQFDRLICTTPQHRNIFAVLPGMDTADHQVIFVEGHMDSRCEVLCDSLCNAQGVEDNATGTALVIELARVMSKYSFNHTIVFLVTISEEQGLYGAEAFAEYCNQLDIPVLAVQNNDVSGGIMCGQTSSPPSCPGLGHIDSIGVRLFSAGSFNSPHKGYCRFIKLEYKEEISPYMAVQTDIRIQSPEDRTGRGGDHIPFRQNFFTAMRMTSANEHGDADVTQPGYSDRQHSYRDTLGVDTDNDQIVDSFYIDFNYLSRNTIINANAIAMAAIGPKIPDFSLGTYDSSLVVTITQQTQYAMYRVGVRTLTNDWDSVYTFSGTLTDTIDVPPAAWYRVSVMSVDTNGIESIPSREIQTTPVGIEEYSPIFPGVSLMQNRPNPFDEATYILFQVDKMPSYKKATVTITDLQGKIVEEIPVTLQIGLNETLYTHGYGATGTYFYSLVIDGVSVETKSMVFAN
jgi:hypothetical protein